MNLGTLPPWVRYAHAREDAEALLHRLAPGRIDTPVSTLDVTPTLAALAGVAFSAVAALAQQPIKPAIEVPLLTAGHELPVASDGSVLSF